MAIEMKVPAVGESITEVTIATWNKKDGDFVKMDEVICELESDKATFELPAEADGILHIVGKEGETLSIGALICSISPAEKVIEINYEPHQEEQVQEQAINISSETINVIVPPVGESITEVTIASWNKKDGDSVAMDEIICELESDKATFELPAPQAGVLKIIAKSSTTLSIGGLVATIQLVSTGGQQSTVVKENTPAVATTTTESSAAGHPSPAASKILAEKNIDANMVQGTGIGGRITKDDALRESAVGSHQSVIKTVGSTPNSPQLTEKTGQRREKMTTLRKTIARRLVAVKNETAMLTTFNEVDMKPIMDLRAKYKDRFKEVHGVGLGFMSFFTKACSIALQEFPIINAYIDGENIVYNDYADIAIAVSAPRGLVVPVIRNSEKMNFAQLEAEVVRLAGKARENKLTVEEMTGGTFTITNGGIFGSMLSTPIINAPQSAILGMHNIVERAVVQNGQIVIRPIMYVAMSYDHRTIDGKDSVSFLVRVKQLLEDPTRILLGV